MGMSRDTFLVGGFSVRCVQVFCAGDGVLALGPSKQC